MKKTGQVAAKSKLNAVQANKKNTLAKGAALKAKQAPARGAKKNVAPKLLAPAKNGKGKHSEDNEDSDEDGSDDLEASMENVPEDSEESNGLSNGDDVLEDSDSDDDITDDDDDENDEENNEDGDNDEPAEEEDEAADEEENNQENDDSEDEAPVEQSIKTEKKPVAKGGDDSNYKERKVYIKRLSKESTEKDIREHFASCGEIETIHLHKQAGRPEAAIVFTTVAASQAALKFHNTIFNGATIHVVHANVERTKFNPEETVLILNVENLRQLEGSKLEKIFSKCGEIAGLSVMCEKNVLAFLTFKNPESVEKALELDGTTQDGLQIKVSKYASKPPKTKVFVRNLARGTTDLDLKKMFGVCGPIFSITIKEGDAPTAVISFTTQEGYCKAFALHEEKLRGRPLLLAPFSENANTRLSKKPFQRAPFKGKRPQSGPMWKSGPPAKKTKQ